MYQAQIQYSLCEYAMNNKLFFAGFFLEVFLILATILEWTSKVNAQGDSSMNTTESAAAGSNLISEGNKTTSTGIGSSLLTPSTIGN
jgi:hypothetical protein